MIERHNYLEKHLEEAGSRVNIPESLTKPLAEDVAYREGYGEIKIERNGLEIVLTYGPTDAYEVFSSVSDHKLVGRNVAEIEKINDWKILEDFVVTDSEGKEIINLKPLLESTKVKSAYYTRSTRNQTVIFPVTNEVPDPEGKLIAQAIENNYNSSRSIMLGTNITSPATIITLFHELGHAARPNIDAEETKIRRR